MLTFKILVVDDKLSNLEKAKNQFKNKNIELICCSVFSVAVDLLKKHKFDIVLTDLMMPGEAEGIDEKNFEIGREVPYGLILAIYAKNSGVKHVAILTDVSHHSGPIAWAMDNLLLSNDDSSIIQCFVHKDWLNVVRKFIGCHIINTPTEIVDSSAKKSLLIFGFNNDYTRELDDHLKDLFDITVVVDEDMSGIPVTFVEKQPDLVLLIGEVDEQASRTKFYVKGIFDKLLSMKNPKQKIMVTGFLEFTHQFYKRSPLTVKQLIDWFNEE